VMEHALEEAMTKIDDADELKPDPAGRIMYSMDGGITFLTIDSPLENLAVYQNLMTTTNRTWSEVAGKIGDAGLAPMGDDWDPSALLGAAWSKEGKITLDAMLYENTTLGINKVTGSGETLQVEYFDFVTGLGEAYDYDRETTYKDTYFKWIVYDEVTGEPEFEYASVHDAVFGGQQWEDKYLSLDDNDTPTDLADDEFIYLDQPVGPNTGVNDFAQAADDSRAVINFIHANVASEIEALPTLVPEEGSLVGTVDPLLG